jgi:SAM-dependent methyltransferase
MDDASFEAFFDSGEREMESALDTIRDLVGRDFHPARALDFGCGVGRLTIPLARESKHVLAVDISPTMLEEAQANCAEQEITNVEFIETKTFARDANRRRFDFVLSYAVFQHIAPRHGVRLTRRMLDMLTTGGFGVLHYVYSRKANPIRRTMHQIRTWVPPLNVAGNLLQRRPLLLPAIPMYRYDLRRLFDLFGSHGCSIVSVQMTEHGGYNGATFFVRKSQSQNILPPGRATRP